MDPPTAAATNTRWLRARWPQRSPRRTPAICFSRWGDYLGYTWTHRTEKKPAPAELTPQARQDIAATATLHGMGYRWSDTNQCWQPPKEEPRNLMEAPVFLVTMGMEAEENTKVLRRYTGRAESAVRAASNTGSLDGSNIHAIRQNAVYALIEMGFYATHDSQWVVERGGDEIPVVKHWANIQNNANTWHNALQCITGVLDLPAGSDVTSAIVPAIEALKSRNQAFSEFSVEQEKHVNSMEGSVSAAFAALRDHGYTPDRGETLGTLIRDAFGAEAAKLRLAKASADGWQKAAAKLREESTDSNSAWHRGHVVGYTSGSAAERERCTGIAQSAADRLDSAIALRIAQEIKNPA